jgi:hypothetical protein
VFSKNINDPFKFTKQTISLQFQIRHSISQIITLRYYPLKAWIEEYTAWFFHYRPSRVIQFTSMIKSTEIHQSRSKSLNKYERFANGMAAAGAGGITTNLLLRYVDRKSARAPTQSKRYFAFPLCAQCYPSRQVSGTHHGMFSCAPFSFFRFLPSKYQPTACLARFPVGDCRVQTSAAKCI